MVIKKTYSIEEKVEDLFKKQLDSLQIRYFTKTESINSAISTALADAESKSGGVGGNRPDIQLFLETKKLRRIPVMIEVKGTRNKLVKFLKNSSSLSKNIDTSVSANTRYAVNGAIHYAKAILAEGSYKECIAIGINGYEDIGELKTEFSAYYLSGDTGSFPQKIEDVRDFQAFKENNLDHLVDILDNLSLSSDELEAAKIDAEEKLEQKIQEIHQELYDNIATKSLLNTDQKLYLFCGLIMAAYPIDGEPDLEVSDLNGSLNIKTNDGAKLVSRIDLFLDKRGTPESKKQIVMNLLRVVFANSGLNKPENGESHLNRLFKKVKKDILPCLNSKLHLDFTGKIFNKLGEWASISTDIKNDVVLTPRYVTNLMVQLAQTDRDSYVLDSAMGSAGFLVSALETMMKDAKENICEPDLLLEKEKKIKTEQICGVEILDSIFMLAVMNMILVGDGSTKLENGNSLNKDFSYFPYTVFLLNPPYSAEGKGMIFVERALRRMSKGFACVLIQENAGAGMGGKYPKEILKHSTLKASIKMPVDLFIGKASVQTAIYLFEAGKPHNKDNLVKFIDFSEDGYTRMSRKKSSLRVNLKDTGHAKEKYAELIARVLNRKTSTDYLKDLVVEDTISLEGGDWTYSQHSKVETIPTILDFKKTVKDYLSWKISEIIQKEGTDLGKSEAPV